MNVMGRMTRQTTATAADWKRETTLAELAARNETVTIRSEGRAPLIVPARELMAVGRISGCLTLDQIEWAFSG